MRLASVLTVPFVALGVFACAFAGCVGDDPKSSSNVGPTTGDRLGPCFPDDKCKEGLECRLPERICLTPGEPVPDGGTAHDGGGGVTDSGGADASADGGGGGDGGACAIPTVAGGTYCGPDLGSCSTGCCVTPADGALACAMGTSCSDANARRFACDGPSDCGDKPCCLNVSNDPGPVTQMCGTLEGQSSTCASFECTLLQLTLCLTADDCGGDPCLPTEITSGVAKITRGVCQTQ